MQFHLKMYSSLVFNLQQYIKQFNYKSYFLFMADESKSPASDSLSESPSLFDLGLIS